MRKKIRYVAAFMALTVLSACSDILDKGPLDKYTENEIWDTDGPSACGYVNVTLLNVIEASLAFSK